jgi:predicted site-specific integrase-resolvase
VHKPSRPGGADSRPVSTGHDDDLLTLAEMAAVLRVSYHTISKWTQRGCPDFPAEAFKLPNGEWRCRRRDLMRWAAKRVA